MTALAADTNRKRTPILGDIVRLPCKASTQFYEGGLLVVASANGYLIPATNATGRYFMGVAVSKPIGPAGTALTTGLTPATDGKYEMDVAFSGRFTFLIASASQADVGKIAYIVDDATVITSTTTGIPCGRVTRYIDSTHVEVDITGFFGSGQTSIQAIGLGAVRMVAGYALFTTTGTTKTVSAGGLTTVLCAFATYDGSVGPAAADGPLSVAGAGGAYTVGSDLVTVTRVAGTSSGAGFSYLLLGT